MYKLVMKGEGGQKEELKRRMEVVHDKFYCHHGQESHYSLYCQVRKYFILADKDGDGQITKAEWFKVLNNAGVPTTM